MALGSLPHFAIALIKLRLLPFRLTHCTCFGNQAAFRLSCLTSRSIRIFLRYEGLKKGCLGIGRGIAALGKLVVSDVSQYLTLG